ncbi:MAG TPA: alpha/beta fold hydrolase [Longimicrobiales bacterium]
MLEPLAAYLTARGWPATHVHIVRFRDPLGSNVEHALEIERAVARLRHASGAGEIAIVAHSMGGLATRWYLGHNADELVRAVIFLATPHRGTWLAWLGWGPGAAEMRPQSPFLRELQMVSLPAGVRAVSFRAPLDTRLLPSGSAWIDGAERRTLSAAGHRRILRHPRVFEEIARVLRET